MKGRFARQVGEAARCERRGERRYRQHQQQHRGGACQRAAAEPNQHAEVFHRPQTGITTSMPECAARESSDGRGFWPETGGNPNRALGGRRSRGDISVGDRGRRHMNVASGVTSRGAPTSPAGRRLEQMRRNCRRLNAFNSLVTAADDSPAARGNLSGAVIETTRSGLPIVQRRTRSAMRAARSDRLRPRRRQPTPRSSRCPGRTGAGRSRTRRTEDRRTTAA